MIHPTFQAAFLGIILLLDVLALSALARGSASPKHKVGWSAAILLLPVIGVLAYVVWGRAPRDAHLPP